MIFEKTYASNDLKGLPNGKVSKEQDDSDSEKDNQCSNHDEDASNAELFVRLTDMVRKHYCGYLEKQLFENVEAWRANKKSDDECKHTESTETESAALKECCRLLEDKALKACMHARRYQRTMLKIIAEVRRSTQEFRLEEDLRKLLITDKTQDKSTKGSCSQKSTQTDESSFSNGDKSRRRKRSSTASASASATSIPDESPCSLTLEQKIEMFQQRLNQETAAIVAATHKQQHYNKTRRQSTHNHSNDKSHGRRRPKHIADAKLSRSNELFDKSSGSIVMPPPSISTNPKPLNQNKINEIAHPNAMPDASEKTDCTGAAADNNTAELLNVSIDSYILEQDDEIAKELDQLFSEEKSELEELLGLATNTQIDDPQVRNILEEIQKAPLTHELKPTKAALASVPINSSPVKHQLHSPPPSPVIQMNEPHMFAASPIIDFHNDSHAAQPHHSLASAGYNEKPHADLKHSLWPCELYMQRRRLTASLSRLIEEDFRWHDIIKWKFQVIFGEDSDDEFATCSPSIELDEILISSCIRRISPWIVKHLMKPMRDGLIANRFLFKKLAKRLAHTIVLENQYADERLIKCAIEEYFCLHQAVLSLEDMTEMPNLKSIDNT